MSNGAVRVDVAVASWRCLLGGDDANVIGMPLLLPKSGAPDCAMRATRQREATLVAAITCKT